jgi:hypothetical protein
MPGGWKSVRTDCRWTGESRNSSCNSGRRWRFLRLHGGGWDGRKWLNSRIMGFWMDGIGL